MGTGCFLPKKQRLGPKLAGHGPEEHPEKFGTPYLFLQPIKKNWYTTGLPCQTQVLGPNYVGSELGEYHSTPHYDDDATVSTCHQKLMGTQISLLSGIKQKI